MKLYVNIPWYRRNEGHSHHPVMTQPFRTKQSGKLDKVAQQWKVKPALQHKTQRTNKSVTAEGSKQDWKDRIISTEPLKLPWLEDSWVGFMEKYTPIEVIREELLQEGVGSIRVRYMGDKQVLLTTQDGIKLFDIIEANNESLSKIFEAIKPWGEGKVVGNKVVWTRCRGIPLSLWIVDCFRKILHKVGSLVDVDEATLNWEKVEYARLKVRTAEASKVQVCEEI